MKNTVTIDVVKILQNCIIAIYALAMPTTNNRLKQVAEGIAEKAVIEAEAAIDALTEKP
jgi:hypothetical protein